MEGATPVHLLMSAGSALEYLRIEYLYIRAVVLTDVLRVKKARCQWRQVDDQVAGETLRDKFVAVIGRACPRCSIGALPGNGPGSGASFFRPPQFNSTFNPFDH